MPGKGCHGDLGTQWQNNFPGNTVQMGGGRQGSGDWVSLPHGNNHKRPVHL